MSSRLSRAEQQQQTREQVLDAAHRLFVDQGFHATSLDQVAQAAGFTKGAIYSNFASKEDLFFAVYERRAAEGVDDMRATIAQAGGGADGLDAIVLAAARRRGHDDGWLAVFFEFWAHVVRRPALRERFAEIHAGVLEPLVEALAEHAARERRALPDDARAITAAIYAMQLGLSLERLTQPDVVDERLGLRMGRLFLDDLIPPGDRQRGADDDPVVPAPAPG